MNKNKQIKSACEESERRERVDKVASILSDVHYNTQEDRDAAILSFSKANLTLEEIDKLADPLRAGYRSAQVYRKGVY